MLDSTNPAGLTDLTAGLAYLTEILVSSFVVAGIVIGAFLIVTIAAWVRAKTFRAVALPVTVFVLQLVAIAVILAANAAIEAAA